MRLVGGFKGEIPPRNYSILRQNRRFKSVNLGLKYSLKVVAYDEQDPVRK